MIFGFLGQKSVSMNNGYERLWHCSMMFWKGKDHVDNQNHGEPRDNALKLVKLRHLLENNFQIEEKAYLSMTKSLQISKVM